VPGKTSTVSPEEAARYASWISVKSPVPSCLTVRMVGNVFAGYSRMKNVIIRILAVVVKDVVIVIVVVNIVVNLSYALPYALCVLL